MKTNVISTMQMTSWERYQQMRVRLAEYLNRELARETGLSEADFDILCALTQSGGESVRALALRCGLGWEKSRLSHQLRRMEQRGLVSRELCTEDSRGLVIRVTEAGREIAAEALAVHHAAVRRHVYDVLTEDQLETLGTIADTVLMHLEKPHST